MGSLWEHNLNHLYGEISSEADRAFPICVNCPFKASSIYSIFNNVIVKIYTSTLFYMKMDSGFDV